MAMPPPIVPAPMMPADLISVCGVSLPSPAILPASRSAKKMWRRPRLCGESLACMNSAASASQPSAKGLVVAISARSTIRPGESCPLWVLSRPARAAANSSGLPPSACRSLMRGSGVLSVCARANATAPLSRSPSISSSIRPICSASSAFSGLPDSIISSAFAAPTTRGSRWVPPAPGSTPSFTSGNPSCASWGRHPVVAGQRHLQAAAQRRAVNGRYHGLAGKLSSRCPPKPRRSGDCSCRQVEGTDVGARHKGAAPRQ